MRIVTVTSQKAYNYGAVLQAYALQQTLLQCGYENQLLDHDMVNKGKQRKTPKVIARDLILEMLKLLHYRESKRFENNFQEFVGKYLISTRTYSSVEEIMQDPPEADCYLTGSDQVFALGNLMVPIRFLEFGAPKTPRVSYAASLGSYAMNQDQLDYIGGRLRAFSSISLREKQGSTYLSEELGLNCYTHIDPVFLLSQQRWSALLPENSRVKGDYVLCFPMLNNRKLQSTIDQLKKETGLPVISVQTKFVKTVKADKYLYDVSVPEFLLLIKNATAVITTSFHCSALSVLFHRPVYSLVGNYKPERVRNLFDMLGLQDRVITENTAKLPSLNMNFENADAAIEREREKAMVYLNDLRNLI